MPAKRKAKPKKGKKKVNYAAMARKYNTTPAKVKKVYARGLAAYGSSGSRKGVSSHAWASARVKSAFTGGPAAKVDKDIIKGKKKTKPKKKKR
tara:strand:- start:436 stop:714 length:279 start_codon:yes stop_codon:yes gene_type:complete